MKRTVEWCEQNQMERQGGRGRKREKCWENEKMACIYIIIFFYLFCGRNASVTATSQILKLCKE